MLASKINWVGKKNVKFICYYLTLVLILNEKLLFIISLSTGARVWAHPRAPQYHLEETNTPKFTSFKPLTIDKVKREIMSMKNKSCKCDQISTPMLKEIITTCLPTITHIVNMSLTIGDFITDWKLAIVRPSLKHLALNLYTRTTDLSQNYPSSPSWLSDACWYSY